MLIHLRPCLINLSVGEEGAKGAVGVMFFPVPGSSRKQGEQSGGKVGWTLACHLFFFLMRCIGMGMQNGLQQDPR